MKKTTLLLFLTVAALGACGGGGSPAPTASSPAPKASTPAPAASSPTPAASTPAAQASAPAPASAASAPLTTPAVVSGVASAGAPLAGAAIRVVDGNGQSQVLIDAVGNRVDKVLTNSADGSYRFTLTSSTPMPVLPLMLQASGVDSAGTPIVLHSTLNANVQPLTVNINPATDAVLAQVLGAAPRSVFANAATMSPTIALLGNATMIAAASTNLKTILASSLTDAKLTTPATLDFFADTGFVANKTYLDAALEGQRIQIARDSSGRDQLQISSKFVAPGVVEVKLDLATAQSELKKAASGSVAKAVTSTLKASTSPLKTGLPNLATIDDMATALNKMIALGSTSSTFSASPLLTSHTVTDGRTRANLVDILAGYAAKNQQLGRWLVQSCQDGILPITTTIGASTGSGTCTGSGTTIGPSIGPGPGTSTSCSTSTNTGSGTGSSTSSSGTSTSNSGTASSSTGCAHVAVSALVTDSNGQVVDIFSDTIGYSTSAASWVFVGNDRQVDLRILPVAQASFNFAGVRQTGALAPSNGLETSIRAVDYATTPMATVQSTLIQVPSGYSVLYRACSLSILCITPNANQTPVGTGELKDTELQRPAPGWVGSLDAQRGGKFAASVTFSNLGTQTLNAYLQSDLPDGLDTAPFATLDSAINLSNLVNGTTLSWINWAQNAPHMRVLYVRQIVDAAVRDYPLRSPFATKLALSPIPSASQAQVQIWLVAIDHLGRRYYSQYSSSF